LIDLIVTEVSEMLLAQDSSITIRTGEKYIHENTSAPRLVWVYGNETLGPPKKMKDSSGMPITAYYTRNANINGHIWGISRAQTEAVLHNVITSIHRILHATSKFGTILWPKASKHLEQGMYCILPLEVYIPVLSGFVTLPTAQPRVPEYPGGIPAGAPTIDGFIVDPDTGLEVPPPSPGDSPPVTEVAINPEDYLSADGDAMATVTVVESGAGANEIVLEQEDDYSHPS
jgi:hypothetical protein